MSRHKGTKLFLGHRSKSVCRGIVQYRCRRAPISVWCTTRSAPVIEIKSGHAIRYTWRDDLGRTLRVTSKAILWLLTPGGLIKVMCHCIAGDCFGSMSLKYFAAERTMSSSVPTLSKILAGFVGVTK